MHEFNFMDIFQFFFKNPIKKRGRDLDKSSRWNGPWLLVDMKVKLFSLPEVTVTLCEGINAEAVLRRALNGFYFPSCGSLSHCVCGTRNPGYLFQSETRVWNEVNQSE